MTLVSACVCTFQRAHVADTVRSMLAQRLADGDAMTIVVVDDDPNRSAEELIAAIATDARCDVRYVVSGARNVSAARNAALDAAQGEWIAFIDDDEIAPPNWLAELLRVQRETNADIVKGYVRGAYPPGTPDWVRAADPFTRDYGDDGDAPAVLASGNVLFRRALVEANKLRFDPQFGRSGGEDSDFFHRLRAAGARVAASRAAIVDEIVPPERVEIGYLRARNRRLGQTDGRKAKLAGGGVRAGLAAAAAASVAWLHPIVRPLHGATSFKLFAKFWYSLGVIEGLSGRATEEM